MQIVSPYFEACVRWKLRQKLAATSAEEASANANGDLLPICIELVGENAPAVEGVEHLLQFAYTQWVDVREDNLELILRTADYFGAGELLRLCYDFIVPHICVENAVNIWQFARDRAHKPLEQCAFDFLTDNFARVVSTSLEFHTLLQPDELDELLASDRLNVRLEEEVFETIIGWVNDDRPKRAAFLFPLLLRVRFGLLPPKYLSAMALVQPDFAADGTPRSWATAAEHFLRCVLPGGARTPNGRANGTARSPASVFAAATSASDAAPETQSSPLRLRHGTSRPRGLLYSCPFTRPRLAREAVLATGGWSSTPTDTIELYDAHADRFVNFPYVDPAGPRAYHGASVIGNSIFCVGGFNGLATYIRTLFDVLACSLIL